MLYFPGAPDEYLPVYDSSIDLTAASRPATCATVDVNVIVTTVRLDVSRAHVWNVLPVICTWAYQTDFNSLEILLVILLRNQIVFHGDSSLIVGYDSVKRKIKNLW